MVKLIMQSGFFIVFSYTALNDILVKASHEKDEDKVKVSIHIKS